MNVPPAVAAFEQRDRDHLNLLSTFHYVFAGLGILGGGLLAAHYWFMNAMMTGRLGNMPTSGPQPPAEALMILRGMYVVFGIMLVVGMALNVLSAVFLRQRRHRLFSIAVAGLNCLQIPLGTTLGVFTIIVLMRESVREGYDLVAVQN